MKATAGGVRSRGRQAGLPSFGGRGKGPEYLEGKSKRRKGDKLQKEGKRKKVPWEKREEGEGGRTHYGRRNVQTPRAKQPLGRQPLKNNLEGTPRTRYP